MTSAVAGPCDEGIATAAKAGTCPNQRMTLAATVLASSLAFVDGSSINVALPVILSLSSRRAGALAARTGPRLLLTAGPALAAIGFALISRAGGDGGYATTVLPGIVVIAIGMARAVAPPTGAVMASVQDTHVGTANGFNSAVARTGGTIATALLGPVLASGQDFSDAFAMAAFAGAALAAIAALSAATLLRRRELS